MKIKLFEYLKSKFSKKKKEEKLFIAAPLSYEAYRIIEKQRQMHEQKLQELRKHIIRSEMQGTKSLTDLMNELNSNNESYQGESFIKYRDFLNSQIISQTGKMNKNE